jgi:fatty-acyl-CoA synthase
MGLDLKLTDMKASRGCNAAWSAPKGERICDVVNRYFKASGRPRREATSTRRPRQYRRPGQYPICGRSKDLIKSGGEWINPAEIEEIVGRHPTIGVGRSNGAIGREVG